MTTIVDLVLHALTAAFPLIFAPSVSGASVALATALAAASLVVLVSALALVPTTAHSPVGRADHRAPRVDLATFITQSDPDTDGCARPRAPGSNRPVVRTSWSV